MPIVQTIAGLLGLVVTIAGIAVSAIYMGKVKGAGLLLAGFSVQAFTNLVFRLAGLMVSSSTSTDLLAVYGFGSLVSVVGSALLVAGVFSVLSHASAGARG